MSDLEPISPEESWKLYIDDRVGDEKWSYDTKLTNEQGRDIFLDWTDEYGLENMNNLSGRDLLRFKNWRKSQDITTISLNGNLAVLRPFLKFAEKIDGVQEDLHEDIPFPEVSEDDEVRNNAPPPDVVTKIGEWLDTYHYASRQHTEFSLIGEVGIRSGAARGIDELDHYPAQRMIQLRHRPADDPDERGTPLKNGTDSQRNINISKELNQLILDYRNNPERPEGTDRYGRKPLFTSVDSSGNVNRISINRIRDDFYKLSRPCVYANNCPEERDVEACEATKNRFASKCPANTSPHPLRSYAIMRQLDEGVPKGTLSDRVDVSVPTLEKHYDHRSEERQREARLNVLAEVLPGYDTDVDDRISAVSNPVTGGLVVGAEVGKRTLSRLVKEYVSLATHDGALQHPTSTRLKRAACAYAVFVGLLATNFHLMGLTGV